MLSKVTMNIFFQEEHLHTIIFRSFEKSVQFLVYNESAIKLQNGVSTEVFILTFMLKVKGSCVNNLVEGSILLLLEVLEATNDCSDGISRQKFCG